MCILLGTIILLENLRFHVEEEGKGVDENGKKARRYLTLASVKFKFIEIILTYYSYEYIVFVKLWSKLINKFYFSYDIC